MPFACRMVASYANSRSYPAQVGDVPGTNAVSSVVTANAAPMACGAPGALTAMAALPRLLSPQTGPDDGDVVGHGVGVGHGVAVGQGGLTDGGDVSHVHGSGVGVGVGQGGLIDGGEGDGEHGGGVGVAQGGLGEGGDGEHGGGLGG